jgi:hypothetical protein
MLLYSIIGIILATVFYTVYQLAQQSEYINTMIRCNTSFISDIRLHSPYVQK